MKHKIGTQLFFRPLGYMACTVVHVTPYHEDGDPHAFVTVELNGGDICTIPVAVQDDYLALEAPKQRPEKQPVVRKAGPLKSILDKFRRTDGKR